MKEGIRKKAYALSVKEVVEGLKSHIDGLEKEEARERLLEYGENKITQDDTNHPVLIFLNQFRSGLIYVLIVAATIAGFFDKWIDVYVIVAVIFLNAILGFVQEYKAERAIRALRDMIVPTAKVYREGELMKLSAEKIVPGDVVLLEEGDRVPADMRIIETKELRINEAPLTGESVPVFKGKEKLSENVQFGDRKNMAWMGTFVAGGKGRGVVTSTADETFFGSIAKDIGEVEKSGGHFEEKVVALTKKMAIFAFSGALAVFLTALLVGEGGGDLEKPILAAIAALVSGIPEGLPAILVIVLAAGATRMAGRNAIIRKLPVTETLGVADHIVSDKTGTITQNTMTVRKIILPEGGPVEVTGEGFQPKGSFYRYNEQILPMEERGLDKLLHIAEICNEAKLTHEENDRDKYEIIGDPTEGALVVLAEKAGVKREIVERKEKKIDDFPFSSKLKIRASLVDIEGNKELYVVGAPEEIIKKASKIAGEDGVEKFTKKKKKEMLFKTERMSKEAMRTIGLAYRKVDGETKIREEMIDDLVFAGVVGMIDPPRKEVLEAVERAKQAGIRVVMCTGDHKKTAAAIARDVGILEGERGDYPETLEQEELSEMSEKEFEESVANVNVFARLTPHMKLRIAKAMQRRGATVAMTGDGVNDAPAVKQADIGIAMGVMGTDVTKEAGDIVLADDNFASIVNAVEEGRIVFENTRRSSSSLITSNFAEIGTILVFLLMGLGLPLQPTQILWVNLVTDGVVGVPLALEPKHKDILRRPPRDKKENILVASIIPYFVLMTVLMVSMALFVYYIFSQQGGGEKVQTAVFTVIAFTQLYNAVNLRSISRSVFSIGFFSNKYMIMGLLAGVILQLAVIWIPFLREAFHFEFLSGGEIFFIALVTSLVLWVGELYKYIHYRVIKKELT